MLEQGSLHGDDPLFLSKVNRLRLDLSSGRRFFNNKAVQAHALTKSNYSSIRILGESAMLVLDTQNMRLTDGSCLNLKIACEKCTTFRKGLDVLCAEFVDDCLPSWSDEMNGQLSSHSLDSQIKASILQIIIGNNFII